MAISRSRMKKPSVKVLAKPVKGAYDKYKAQLELCEEIDKYIDANERFVVISRGPVLLIAAKIKRNVKHVFDGHICMVHEKVEMQELIIPILIYLKDEMKTTSTHRYLLDFGCMSINIQNKNEIEEKLSKIV